MLGALNHVAIAVPSIEAALPLYRDVLGAKISPVQALPEHGVSVVFIELHNTMLELLEPLGENSPILNFLQKNPNGGIHHISIETPDVSKAAERLKDHSIRLIGEPRTGAHGTPVIFMHPKDTGGVLLELEEHK